ncbi:L-rhamnose mutarotase [Glaciihabitans sp. UYNi722]|uniref:L-rhamnose mutarotase n=1 Tax=Glaciihabitans sp. UYNi722 TaxID=3156344 RepID=UPI00339AB8E8
MRRVAAVIGIEAADVAEYERLHAAVWPAVLARLTASNMHNYSIFRHGDLLFSYLEYTGDDFESDNAAIAADPATQRWWALCKPLQRQLNDGADDDWWKELPELFHLD